MTPQKADQSRELPLPRDLVALRDATVAFALQDVLQSQHLQRVCHYPPRMSNLHKRQDITEQRTTENDERTVDFPFQEQHGGQADDSNQTSPPVG